MTQFRDVATTALDSYLAADPVSATYLGDHRHDGELPDPSSAGAATRARQLREQLSALAECATADEAEAIDAEVLRTVLRAELFELEELREAEWNPMLHNPGGGLHALLTRDFAPLPERLASLTARLGAVADYLAAARDRLGEMSGIHLDTALRQLDGTLSLLDDTVPAVLCDAPQLRGRVQPAVEAARRAVAEHRAWLAARTDGTGRDPRIGARLFAGKLALTLDTDFDPAALLARAAAELDESTQLIVDEAGRYAGVRQADATTVRVVLDELAAERPTDETILDLCRDALADTTRFVRDHELVTVYDDPIAVVEMPEIDRGVSVAYCRPPGPLETAQVPTEIAVSPTPSDWTPEQQASLYREYNLHMLHNLAVHEAMPGHALQLAHSNRYHASTPVRAVWWSGPFVEGWAVYSEELMADHGYRGDISAKAASALRMQQLKMRLRSIINTIMDIRFHHDDLDEAAAMALMTGRGFQEPGEAAGKWRRVQLTATQLCTYYVGYCEVRDLTTELAGRRPEWTQRQLHDAVLSAGSPPARHLRALLLDPA
ncbi:MAG TPA: DUF885 domain-containing protein [Jatrophihabitantaceae bacterium]|jgi:uncharacterized protein (DUF885 family)